MNDRQRPLVEMAWFSALCDDDYEFLGVPDPLLASTFEHCRNIVLTADRYGFDNVLLPSGYQLGIDNTAFCAAMAPMTTLRMLLAVRCGELVVPQLARQLATLDQLSGGRAAWNVVTSFDAFTGQNFRRGGFLDHSQRYERAQEMIEAVRTLWDSWDGADPLADKASGRFLSRPDAGAFTIRSSQFDITGRFPVPRSPQGRPVILQAGVSPQGRGFAARSSDAIFSPYGRLPEAAEFYRDVKARAVAHGATFAAPALLGDDDGPGPFAVIDDHGALLAVYERKGGGVKPSVVLAPQEST